MHTPSYWFLYWRSFVIGSVTCKNRRLQLHMQVAAIFASDGTNNKRLSDVSRGENARRRVTYLLLLWNKIAIMALNKFFWCFLNFFCNLHTPRDIIFIHYNLRDGCSHDWPKYFIRPCLPWLSSAFPVRNQPKIETCQVLPILPIFDCRSSQQPFQKNTVLNK